MNKPTRNVLLIVIAFVLVAFTVYSFLKEKPTQLSPQSKIEFKEAGLVLNVVYCQPSVRGRLIFGGIGEEALQPYGQYWRLGANEATTIELNKNLKMGDNMLPKGIYSVYAVPGKSAWKIGFNSIVNRWGASEPDYSKDIFTMDIPVNYTDESNETFTIYLSNDKITFWWDTSKVILPYSVSE